MSYDFCCTDVHKDANDAKQAGEGRRLLLTRGTPERALKRVVVAEDRVKDVVRDSLEYRDSGRYWSDVSRQAAAIEHPLALLIARVCKLAHAERKYVEL